MQEMKLKFPELTTERLHALFMWTVWMFERTNQNSCPSHEEDSVPSATALKELSVVGSEEEKTLTLEISAP